MGDYPDNEGIARMTDKIGCDFAFQPHPSIEALRAAGIKFVGRYASGNPGKDITPPEAHSYRAAGIDVVLFNETTGTSILTGGESGGVSDATTADEIAKARGLHGCPIYFTADFDPNALTASEWLAIDSYLRGAAAKIGHNRVGGYGGLKFISHCFDHDLIRFGCQTIAWSFGVWDPRASIRQFYQVTLGGALVDMDVAMKADFGQFPRPAVHTPYLHHADGHESMDQIAAARHTTVPFLLAESAAHYRAADVAAAGALVLPAGLPYYTLNP